MTTYSVLQYIEVIVTIIMIFVILIQNKNVSLNLSTMGGGMWATTKRWAEKVLHNATVILALIFIINSVALFLIAGQ